MGSKKSGIQITITNMVFGSHLNKTLVWYSGGCYACNKIGVLEMNKTTSVPKSVLLYDVDKDLT